MIDARFTRKRGGTKNMNISLSIEAHELMESRRIHNRSEFISSLVISALKNQDFLKKKLIGEMSLLQEQLRNECGLEIELDIKKSKSISVV